MPDWTRPVLRLALVLAIFTVAAAASAQSLPAVRYEGYHAAFPSGMRVVAYQFPGTRMVSVAASYLGGRVSEPAGKEGVAELTARLLLVFTGRQQGSEDDGPRARPSIGQRSIAEVARNDVSVETEATLFWSRTVPGKLEAVLSLEAERLRDPLAGVSPDDLERVRMQLLEEIERAPRARNGDEERWAVLGAVLPPAMLRPRPPTAASVRGITWDDVEAYAKATHAPDRLILAITGPVSAKVAGRMVQGVFRDAVGDDQRRIRPAVPADQPPLPDAAAATIATRSGKVAKPRLWIAWRVPGTRSPDGRYLTMVRDVAGALVAEASRGTGRVAFRSLDDLGSVGLVSVAVDLDDAGDAASVMEALREREAKPWTPQRMRGFLDSEINGWFEWLRNPNASAVARLTRQTSEVDALEAHRALLASPLGPDVQTAFRRWLDPARAVSVLEVPEGRVGDETAEAAARAVGLGAGTPTSVPPWVNRLPAGRYDVYSMAQPPGLAAAWRERLPGGLEVVGLERAGFPSIEARLVVRMRSPVWGLVPGLAVQALRPAPKLFGNASCPTAEISVNRNAVTLSSEGRAGTLPARLRELACVTHLREFSGVTFGNLRTAQYRKMRDLEKTGDHSLMRMLREAHRTYAGGDVWTWPGSADEIDDIPTGAAEAWIRSEFRPELATLVLVGDLPDQATVLAEVRKAFGEWKGTDPAPDDRERQGWIPSAQQKPDEKHPGRSVLVGDVPGDEEAWVIVSVPWPAGAARDPVADNVVMLDLQRRLDRGSGTGVRGAEVERDDGLGRAIVTFRCRPAEAAGAIEQALRAIETTREAPVLAETAAFGRWMMARRYPLAFETHDEVANALAGLASSGLPPDYWDRFPSSISSLQPERVEGSARRLGVGRETVAVIGSGAELRKALAAAGMRDATPPAP